MLQFDEKNSSFYAKIVIAFSCTFPHCVIYLIITLLSRNFCRKCVRPNRNSNNDFMFSFIYLDEIFLINEISNFLIDEICSNWIVIYNLFDEMLIDSIHYRSFGHLEAPIGIQFDRKSCSCSSMRSVCAFAIDFPLFWTWQITPIILWPSGKHKRVD